jgi:DNA-binding NarL/FixJ family response regulator
MNAPIRVLIVDDHPIVREGLRGAFTGDPDFEVVGEAGNGADALAMVATFRPDVVLMDLRMPAMDGVTAIRELQRAAAPPKVLVLTTFDTDGDVLASVEAGATGYLLKDAPTDELLRAVRAAHRGESVLSPSVAGRLMGQLRKPDPKKSGRAPSTALTKREFEVLELIAGGATNREAAKRLFISEASVKTHLLHIYAKLGVRDRAAAVGEAYRRGLLTP